ncbi:MAG: alcohol dehydrogenase [Treponema sp.]|nr:MAG: alcohol dehydrogenase [Treponema sp.]
MADFNFKLSPEIILGNYSLARLGEKISPFGSNFMLITTHILKEAGVIDKITKVLDERGISLFVFDGIGETPDSDVADRALSLARGAHIDGVISVGGITACAIGKVVASLYNETTSLYDFVEGLTPSAKPLPLVQVSTICGDPYIFMKASPVVDSRNRSVQLIKLQEDLCKLVVFDPNTYSGISPNMRNTMVYSGVLAAFEGYISQKADFFSGTILKKAIELFLITVNPKKEKLITGSKEQILAEASCLTSMGLEASAPGVGTAIAITCGGRYNISPSLISTILLPHIMSDAIRSNLDNVVEIAKLLDTDLAAETDAIGIAKSGILEIRRQLAATNLPTRLKDVDITIESMVPVAENTSKLGFMSYTPRPMSGSDVFELIKEAF